MRRRVSPASQPPIESSRDRAARWWWAVAPSAALAEVAFGLQRGEPPAGATAIKADERRTVWSVPGVAGGLLVKRFAVRGGETLKYALRPSRARSEYRAMEALVRLGLPVVRPLGFGERREGAALREAWFVGRLVPQARTLAEAVAEARSRGDEAAALALVRAALEVVVQLHAHPWLHRDLHAGNLLLDEQGRLLIADLHSVWRVPVLTRRMRLENLARLLFSLRDGLDLDRAPELLRGYAERRGEDAAPLIPSALAALAAFERRYVEGRVRRCLTSSTLFAAERVPEGRVFHRREYALDVLRADLAEHARWLAEGGSRVLGSAPRSRVTLVGEGEAARVVKEYVPAGVAAALRQRLGAGRARSAWVGARRLAVLGLPTPEALALLERRDGTAVLVTRALRDARPLRQLAPELARERSPDRRAAVATALGHLVGRLARAGLRHADLSDKNVWIASAPSALPRDLRDAPPPGAASLRLIDLDGLRRMPPHDPRGVARMLGQLADLPARPTSTDLRRFARAFALGARRELAPEVAAEALQLATKRAAARGPTPASTLAPGAGAP
jgi:tRNA A-37 threonylcarbamoyl transferase component Bud32